MQARDHKKLAEMFAVEMSGNIPYIYVKMFIFGNVEPDKNLFTYLHGMMKGKKFHGHNYENILPVMKKLFDSLQEKRNWGIREYYHFGKLMHYTADVFTFPHNSFFHGNLKEHCKYEQKLHKWFQSEMRRRENKRRKENIFSGVNIEDLHEEYSKQAGNCQNDCMYICIATEMLFRGALKTVKNINSVRNEMVEGQVV